MTTTPLYMPHEGLMRVAGFMSGSGTNIRELIKDSKQPGSGYEVALIFTDKPTKSNAAQLAQEYQVPWAGVPFMEFFDRLGKDRTKKEHLPFYYEPVAMLLGSFGIDAVALGGYMRMVPREFIEALPLTVNVHPADLSLRGPDGRRLYVGDKAMELVMAAGEREARATTFFVDEGEDTGDIALLSKPMPIDYAQTADENQGRLKEVGDWRILPLTMRLLASGRLGANAQGALCLDQEPIPDGKRLEELI